MAVSLYLRFVFFQMVRGAYNDPLISFIEKMCKYFFALFII